MVAKEIKIKLQEGSKLTIEYNSCFRDRYYIESDKPENRLTVNQFHKYREFCRKKDESENNDMGIKFKTIRHHYWL